MFRCLKSLKSLFVCQLDIYLQSVTEVFFNKTKTCALKKKLLRGGGNRTLIKVESHDTRW